MVRRKSALAEGKLYRGSEAEIVCFRRITRITESRSPNVFGFGTPPLENDKSAVGIMMFDLMTWQTLFLSGIARFYMYIVEGRY